MGKKLDLIGKTFNRLTVVGETGRDERSNVLWSCECVCGNKVTVNSCKLKSGNTQSCGCLQVDKIKETNTTHGLRKNPLYHVWYSMKARCFNSKNERYENYGGRGITVCDRWKESLEDFIGDVSGGYEERLQLDRINNDGDYEPNNVRWVTPQQNLMNKGVHRNSSSKYKGVSWSKASDKWMAKITKEGKLYYLGLFIDEASAALAYNEKAKELFGEYANLNKVEVAHV